MYYRQALNFTLLNCYIWHCITFSNQKFYLTCRNIIQLLNYESNIAVFWKEFKEKIFEWSGDNDPKKPQEGSSGTYTEEANV